MSYRGRLCVALLGPTLWLSTNAGAQTVPANLDLEQGEIGQVPRGWFVPPPSATAGYTAKLSADGPRSGQRSAVISREGEAKTQGIGNLMQAFDAGPYRGKRVRLRAAVRADVSGFGNRAQLWLRVDRKDQTMGFFDNMNDRPITAGEWSDYEILGEVAPDAERINIGLMLIGVGRAWLDAVSFEILGEAGAGNEPPRPLPGRGLENLVAFTRLLGYVRYFHPSDEAAGTNWDAFAMAGVRAVEDAKRPADLARVLEDLFRPIAPTVRIFPTGQRPAIPPELSPPRNISNPKSVAWYHHGLGGNPNSPYFSRRINSKDDKRQDFGTLTQSFVATPYRGKRVRLRAAVRAEVAGPGNQAQLWLRVDGKDRKVRFFDNMEDRPIVSKEWREYEITGDIAEDAERIFFGCFLRGEGRAWLDAVFVEILGPTETLQLANPDFEEGEPGATPPGWFGPSGSGSYTAKVTEQQPKSGKRCAVIASEGPARALPDPSRPYTADLGGGVSCLVPLAVYSDGQRTLPRAPSEKQAPPSSRPPGFVLSGNDRSTRLAAVVLAWNVFQHFYPYFDVVRTDWPAALRRALAAAAADADDSAFLGTLRRLVAELRDGHGNVMGRSGQPSFMPPFLWDQVEGRLVVTHVAPGTDTGLKPGDVILRINGKPVAESLAEQELLVSGATPEYRGRLARAQLLSGAKDSEIALEVQSHAGAPSPLVKARRTLSALELGEPRPPKVNEIKPGIVYADLGRVTDQEFESAIPLLEKAKGIIFDLRGYPRVSATTIGHLIDQPVTSAQWRVPIVTYPDRETLSFGFSNWTVQPKVPRFRAKVAFLTDERAISYAETYLGIIEYYKLAQIVGQPTAGTNGNVNPVVLPGGYRVVWTGMKVLKHDGSQHHGIGIRPTVPAARTLRGVTEGRDEVLERGIVLVSRQ